MTRIGQEPCLKESLDGNLVLVPGIVEPAPGSRQLSESEGWLTTQEAAAYAGVSRYVISRLTKACDLRVYTTPFDKRKRYVRREDLDALQITRPPADAWQIVWNWIPSVMRFDDRITIGELQETSIALGLPRILASELERASFSLIPGSHLPNVPEAVKDACRQLVRDVAWAQFRGYSNTHVLVVDPTHGETLVRRSLLRKKLNEELSAHRDHPGAWMVAPLPADLGD